MTATEVLKRDSTPLPATVETNKEHFQSFPVATCEVVDVFCNNAFDILVDNGVLDPKTASVVGLTKKEDKI